MQNFTASFQLLNVSTKMQHISSFLLLSCVLLLAKSALGEDCIDYDEHKDEIEGCCSLPPALPGDNAKECAEEAKGKASDVHNLYACFFECYSERNGIVSGNSVNLDTLNGFADAQGGAVGDAWKAVFAKCAGTSDEIIQSIQGHSLKCNPYALELKTCFVFEIDRVCPDEYFQSSELCDKIRGGTPYCHHQ